jgi:hypothetical protein
VVYEDVSSATPNIAGGRITLMVGRGSCGTHRVQHRSRSSRDFPTISVSQNGAKVCNAQALEIISSQKSHQSFKIPTTDKRGSLKVARSIAGVPIREPSILFSGGMYEVRLQALSIDWLAKKAGVRLIFADRFVLHPYLAIVGTLDRIRSVIYCGLNIALYEASIKLLSKRVSTL